MNLKAPKKPENYRETTNEYFWDAYVIPAVLEKYGKECVKCGAPSELVHHNSYDPDINIDDLSPLCKRCHQKLHKRSEYDADDYDTNWEEWENL